MLVLTEDAVLLCGHKFGKVNITATQGLVTINRRNVLVEPNPAARPIALCPQVPPIGKSCTLTFAVEQGYCGYIYINGSKLCLSTVEGLTDGSPAGTIKYNVANAGQNFVEVQ